MLNPTPPHLLTDAQGRPYFLWDSDLTLEAFRCRLASPDLEVRAYFAGKLMRQAKPDDVFEFLSAAEMRALWPHLERYLGHARPFWSWLLEQWEALDRGRGARDASCRSEGKMRMRSDDSNDLDMRPEYDFSHGVRGKYADRFSRGCTVVVLDPDIAEAFPDAASVNETLREVLAQRGQR